MPLLPDHYDLPPLAIVPSCRGMHLCNQRACGIDREKVPALGLLLHRGGDSMGGKDDRPIIRALIQLVDEDDTFRAKFRHNTQIVNNVMPYVDRRPPPLQGKVNYFEGTFHPRAIAPGLGEEHLQLAPAGHCGNGFQIVLSIPAMNSIRGVHGDAAILEFVDDPCPRPGSPQKAVDIVLFVR